MRDEQDPAQSATLRELLGQAPFAITARIALQLGRESISNSIVALIELVKNSYDADAENVYLRFRGIGNGVGARREILVDDDGNGMTQSQVEQSWLIIGTDTKLVANRSKNKQRVLTGEKGLGRLGLDRLCARTQMQTFTKDQEFGLELSIDWTKYEGTNASLQSVTHELYRIPKLQADPMTGMLVPIAKGTRLILSDVKDVWPAEELERLRTELSLLVSPFQGINDFHIHLYTDGVLSPEGPVVSDDLLNAAEWKVVAELQPIDGEYSYSFSMTSPRREASFHIGPTPWAKVFPELRSRQPECGPLRFEFYYIPREDVPELSLKRAQIVRFMDSNQGLRIYRDGFRVMPYGKPSGEGDWLNLGLRRTRSPTSSRGPLGGWKVGYNQIIGAVFIGREQNAALLDQTNREGIVEGQAYHDLRRFALKSVEDFELQHQKYEKAQGPKSPSKEDDEVLRAREAAEKSSQASLATIEQIKDAVQSAAQLLTDPHADAAAENASGKIGELYDLVETLGRAVSEQQGMQEQFVEAVGRREEVRFEEFQRQKDTLGNLASLGILATAFGHETEAASNIVLANSSELERLVAELFWIPVQTQLQIRESVENVVHGAKKINTFATFTLRNVARDKRSRKKVYLDKVARRVFTSFAQTLREDRNIDVLFDVPGDAPPITAFSIDWESIIVNFITNSVWALDNAPLGSRIIRVRLRVSKDFLTFSFADSGCGIAAGTEERIFVPTFSTKRNPQGDIVGTGMGLAIVQGFVESYGGSIRVEAHCDLGGAQFVIDVPLRGREQEARDVC